MGPAYRFPLLLFSNRRHSRPPPPLPSTVARTLPPCQLHAFARHRSSASAYVRRCSLHRSAPTSAYATYSHTTHITLAPRTAPPLDPCATLPPLNRAPSKCLTNCSLSNFFGIFLRSIVVQSWSSCSMLAYSHTSYAHLVMVHRSLPHACISWNLLHSYRTYTLFSYTHLHIFSRGRPRIHTLHTSYLISEYMAETTTHPLELLLRLISIYAFLRAPSSLVYDYCTIISPNLSIIVYRISTADGR